MKNEIREHYREEDIQKLKLHKDIENWNAEISFTKKEIRFFSELLQNPLLQNTTDQQNTSLLLQELKTMEENNGNYSDKVLSFSNTLEGLNECEDLQCETYFLNSHEELREELIKHGVKFQELKEQIFANLSEENKR